MKIIVAVGEDWGIGKDNKLLFSIREDMKFFKETTMGGVVVMGKNTYLSLPKRPLPGRVNIVLTTSFSDENCVTASGIDELKEEIKKYPGKEVFVIGGASIYRQMLPYCSHAYITKVHATKPADAYFENLDLDPDWECVQTREAFDGYALTFCTYENKNIKGEQ